MLRMVPFPRFDGGGLSSYNSPSSAKLKKSSPPMMT